MEGRETHESIPEKSERLPVASMKKDGDVQFNPDKELLEFADLFAGSYKVVDAGDYHSQEDHFHIKYLPTIEKTPTVVRVNSITHVMEFDKSGLEDEKYTADFVFFMILWCVVRVNAISDTSADIATWKYYVTTSRSKKDVINGWMEIFKKTDTLHNRNRLDAIMEFIKDK